MLSCSAGGKLHRKISGTRQASRQCVVSFGRKIPAVSASCANFLSCTFSVFPVAMARGVFPLFAAKPRTVRSPVPVPGPGVWACESEGLLIVPGSPNPAGHRLVEWPHSRMMGAFVGDDGHSREEELHRPGKSRTGPPGSRHGLILPAAGRSSVAVVAANYFRLELPHEISG